MTDPSSARQRASGWQLFVLLDNLKQVELDSMYAEAELKSVMGDRDAAGDDLRNKLKDSGHEGEWLGQWLSEALKRNVAARITPLGLHKRDVIEYLPVQELVPGSNSWASLRDEHEGVRQRDPNMKDFKHWLRQKKKA